MPQWAMGAAAIHASNHGHALLCTVHVLSSPARMLNYAVWGSSVWFMHSTDVINVILFESSGRLSYRDRLSSVDAIHKSGHGHTCPCIVAVPSSQACTSIYGLYAGPQS